nr:putative ribonuclease H-like domain-containing protein [Tanacetum cinerariifolium]
MVAASKVPMLKRVNTANKVSTSNTQVNVAFSTNINNLSDDVICAFLASQPNSPQLVHEDLEQIHPYDMEEIDLRWQMAMLTVRARSDQAEEGPNYAIMAFTSLSSDSKKSELMVLGYKSGLKSVEERLKFFKKNEFIYLEDIKVLKVEIQMKDIAIEELRKKLEKAQKEKDGIQFTLEKLENASKRNFMPLKPYLSYTGLDEFTVKPVVENKSSEEEIKVVRKNTNGPIIEEWVSNDEEENVTQPKIVKKTVRPALLRKSLSNLDNKRNLLGKDQGVIDNGCSRHMKRNMSYLTDYKEIDRGCVAFGWNPKGEKFTGKVVTYDYSRFTWVFFLSTKDETSGILKSFITRIENLVDHKVKVIRYDNGTEFKNREMNQICEINGILRQFSVARTPQQNGVTERRNRTLIEASRTKLVDSKLPTTFWAEAVNTACYVKNRVLVVKPHNMTLYELFHGSTPILSFMRLFGCPVTILNTKNHLGKFNGKADEEFFVGYSLNSKAFRVFNSITRIVEENLHIRFSKNTPNVVGSGLDWLFDINALTRTINYEPIVTGTQSNDFAGTKASNNVGQARKEIEPDDGFKPSSDDGKKVDEDPSKENKCNYQEKEDIVNNTNNVNTVSSTVNAAGTNEDNELPFDPNMPAFPTPTTRIHKYHPLDQVIGDLHSATQTRNMIKNLEEHRFTEVKNASTPMETQKPLLKDEDGEDMDVHMYRYQVNLKVSHLRAMKMIFRYLKGHPKLGLQYLKDSPFDLVAYTDSDYTRASLDRKSTTREVEYVVASSCYGQVLWIQNQLLDYGY